MQNIKLLATALAVPALLIFAAAPASAATTTVAGVSLNTPTIPGVGTCGATVPTFDTITVTGISNTQHVGTSVHVTWGGNGSGPNVPQVSSPTNPTGANPITVVTDYNANTSTQTIQVSYPPTSQWPINDPTTNSGELHVDISVFVYDALGVLVPNPGTGQGPTLGPGQDWDINCVVTPPPPTAFGTRTIGYWKTHANAWPVSSVTVGCTTLTKTQALAILADAKAKDMTYMLAAQLIGAELNVAAGGPTTGNTAINNANAFLCAHPVGSNPQGADRTTAENYKNALEAYNLSQDV
jgi:hypothetical protein